MTPSDLPTLPSAGVIKVLPSIGELESQADLSHDGGPDGVKGDRAV